MLEEDKKNVGDTEKSEYLYRQLSDIYLGIYHLNRSPLGKLLKAVNAAYILVTLRPKRKTIYNHLLDQANNFIQEQELSIPEQGNFPSGRLKMAVQIMKFALGNPYTTLKQANWYRIKRVIYRLCFADATQTHTWVNDRFPTADSEKLSVKIFSTGESTDLLNLAFPKVQNPLVSIIIPVYNQYRMTISCLQSILEHSKEIDFEIIIADDCSTDLTTSISERISGIKVVKTPGNQGFLKNCNLAAAQAQGEFILLLNNDTNVQPQWLDHLLSTFNDSAIGLVGPKLLFSDGVLQEAGGIIWQDGSGWNYGRGQNPQAPEFNYTRESDYISGACILIKTQLWRELGGFDERFVPAYYEDTDLAFSIRAKGLKVIYQPKSVVVHFEGVSNGTDLNSGMKKHQVKNREVFFDKWKAILAKDHFKNGQQVFLARDRSKSKNTVLFIDHYVPFYDKDAGSRSTYMYVKAMVELGYNIKFMGANFFPHQPYTQALQDLGVEVLFGDRFARNWPVWLKENAIHIDTIYLHRPHITEDFIEPILKLNNRPRLVYFGHDLHYIRTAREYEVTGTTQLKNEVENWRTREWDIFSKVDRLLYPSNEEVFTLTRENKNLNVKQLPLYQLNPPTSYSQAGRNDMLFVGGFNHSPNVDGILWFVKEVLPLVNTLDCRLHIVGSSAPSEVLKLSSDRVIVHGFLSDEDLSQLYRTSRLAVVPLRYGAGVKGKVLEAMQAGIPIATTPIGAEGIPEADTLFAISATPEEFARNIDRLYTNETASVELVEKYSRIIAEHFSDNAIKTFNKQNIPSRRAQ